MIQKTKEPHYTQPSSHLATMTGLKPTTGKIGNKTSGKNSKLGYHMHAGSKGAKELAKLEKQNNELLKKQTSLLSGVDH